MRVQTVFEKGLTHREARSQQTEALIALATRRLADAVANVKERDRACLFNPGGELVHGVCAQHERLRASARQAPRAIAQQGGGRVPIARRRPTSWFIKA